MAGLEQMRGQGFGPFSVEVTADRVAEFVGATGDDPVRWSAHAPPLFANVVLFSAAPALLEDSRVAPFTRSLIHSEQSYAWLRTLSIGERLEVIGTVTGVRRRGPLHLVGFEIAAASDRGEWLTGEATFLMAEEAAAESAEETEPPVGERPPVAPSTPTASLPPAGGALEPLPCGASRIDLVRYAGATRDWNPIHWDHEAARSAGLPGIVVHGLLMAAWLGRAAARYGAGPAPLESMRVRFRRPLRPGVGASIVGSVAAVDPHGADLDLALEAARKRLVTARARVTR